MRLRTPWLPIIMLGLAGCGNETELPNAPELFTDRNAMTFNTEQNSGTFIGTTTFNSLRLENRGTEALVITGITLNDPANPDVFTLKVPEGFSAETPLRLETYDRAFIEVAFKPADDIDYRGTLTIQSNAGNGAEKVIELVGKGIAP